MIEQGLKKAAAFSFGAHLLLVIVIFVIIGRAPSIELPSPYTVRLVSPSDSDIKAMRVPPAKTHVPLAKEPAAEEPSVKTVKAPPPKKAADLTEYSEEKIAALREQREKEQELEAKERALDEIRKEAQVRELAEAKASVSVTAKAVGKPGGGSLVGDYVQSVRSRIEQEWTLAGTGREGLYAIITVRVFKNGTLKVTDMERSSGDAIFDRSALRAIEKASPVAPPPYEMELGVRFIPTE